MLYGNVRKEYGIKQKTKRNHRIEKRAVLLITSSIVPQEKRFLILKEPKQRLSQYLDSLRFYIVHTNLNNIALCDNSGFNFPVDEMTALAKEYGKKLEIIQFVGDKKKIIENGKGYGEGEIIEYALHHSLLLKKSSYFIKVTGRLKVTNIDQIIERIDLTKIYMNKNIHNFRKSEKSTKMNTVLYGIPKKIYMAVFVDAYKNVCDKRGIYLEHVFAKRIIENGLIIYNIPHFPVIDGISGSLGNRYQETIGWERCLYELLSRWSLFNCDLLRDTVTYTFDR